MEAAELLVVPPSLVRVIVSPLFPASIYKCVQQYSLWCNDSSHIPN